MAAICTTAIVMLSAERSFAQVDPFAGTAGRSPYTVSAGETATDDNIVDQIVAKMSTAQKIAYIGTSAYGVLSAFALPTITSSEGIDGETTSTALGVVYPSGVSLSATWDPAMAALRGREVALDAAAGGVQMVNGPGLNMYRTPHSGRQAEYIAGEDPILGAVLGTAYVEGEQSAGIMSELKHAFGYDQESDRAAIQNTIDETTLHEISELPMEAAVKIAQPAAIMCAFTAVNTVHSCENTEFIQDIIRGEWGFNGFIQSDYGAIFDVGPSLKAGTDWDGSGGYDYTADTVAAAIASGSASSSDLDEAVRLMIRQIFRFGFGANVLTTSAATEPDRAEGEAVATAAEEEGIVLLKNNKSVLPLDSSVRKIAVLGAFANLPPARPAGSGYGSFRHYTTELAGLEAVAPAETQIDLIEANTLDPETSPTVSGWQATYFSSPEWQGYPVLQREDGPINFDWSTTAEPGCSSGACGSVVWTAQIKPTITGDYVFKVRGNGAMQVLVNGTRIVVTNDTPVSGANGFDMPAAAYGKMALTAGQTYDVTVTYSYESYWASYLGGIIGAQFSYAALSPDPSIKDYDAVIVSGGRGLEYDGEGRDQDFDLPEYQSELIKDVAAVNKKTVAVIYAAQGVDMTAFNDGVAGLVYAWYPGQNGGTALANVLFGKVTPSGKLPITIDKSLADCPACAGFPLPVNYSTQTTIDYSEGIFFGYRGYDLSGKQPLYPFGFGLSYTTFKYSGLTVTTGVLNGQPIENVAFTVTNSGRVAGAEAAQVYVGRTSVGGGNAVKQLEGFERETLGAGETKHYLVQLPMRAFSTYDATTNKWDVLPGSYRISVGGSSADLPLVTQWTNRQFIALDPKKSLPIVDPGFQSAH